MGIFTQDYVEAYVRELSGDHAFTEAGRWFDGRVAFVCDRDLFWIEVKGGRVSDFGLGMSPSSSFTLSGSEDAWRELFSPETVNGTINRLLRQGKIRIEGDLVRVMFYWKMVFTMTEAGDRVPLPGAA